MPADRTALAGLTIALAEHRELDRLAEMVIDLGGIAYRCPFVSIVDAPDPAPIIQWLERLAGGGFDDLVLLTGEGIARFLKVARESGLEERAIRALSEVRTVCRGPKPVRALRAVGVRAALVAESPTSEGIIATLEKEDLTGRRIGVQLYGEEPNDKLVDFLLRAGAQVHTVAPYAYQDGPDAPLLELIEAMSEGRIHAITFTSSPQVQRLFQFAQARDLGARLQRGFEQTHVAAVGPVVAAALAARGVGVDIVPSRSFFLRPLVSEIADFFRQKSPLASESVASVGRAALSQ